VRRRAVRKKDLAGKPGKTKLFEDISIARSLSVKWIWKKEDGRV